MDGQQIAAISAAPRWCRTSRTIDVRIIRGGSSKGVFLDREELGEGVVDEPILKLFGSPARRQIDGLGGGDKLTSKVAVMGAPTKPGCDLDYLFGQVSIEKPRIDWGSNCGNISAGAALYAALVGAGEVRDEIAHLTLNQINTGRRLKARVPLCDGLPATGGDFAIGGVPGTGARIDLDFADFVGSCLGLGALPTGCVRDRFRIPGLGPIEASVVDMANLHIFVRAEDIGLDITATIFQLQADSALLARLESIRKTVAADLDFIAGEAADEELQVSMNPLVYALAPPIDYTATNGERIESGRSDLCARSLSRSAFSKAYPGSGAVGTALAAGIQGSLVQEVCAARATCGEAYDLCIGHPGGTLSVTTLLTESSGRGGEDVSVESCVLGRTARLLMEGRAHIL